MVNKILKTVLFFVFFVFIHTTTIAQDATMWTLDKSHTFINFSINHFFSTVTGTFRDFEGNFNFDPENLKGSKANFSININSVNTGDTKRDGHIQTSDFFDSSTYPKITFVSTKIEKKSKDYLVHGKLTIKNITREIVLPLKITGEMEHPMMKGTIILGLSTTLKINRNDYGVGTGDWAATMVVGNEVSININMELNRMK